MSNTIKELWDAFKGQLSDRLANPFTGALLISWCIINFRLLVVLFWIEPYQQKFTYIDTVLYPTLWHWALRAVAAPAIAAYAYLLLYPKATMWAATQYRRMQSQANNEMRAAQGEALMTHDEHRAARAQLTQIESKIRADMAEAADRVSRQDDLIELQRSQLKEHKERADRLVKQLATLNENPAMKSLADSAAVAIESPSPDKPFEAALREHPPGPSKSPIVPASDSSAPDSALPMSQAAAWGEAPETPLPSYDEVAESQTKINLLTGLANTENGIEIEGLAALVGRAYSVVLHHLETMADLGLVEKIRYRDGTDMWHLSKLGRAFVVKNRLVEP